MPNQDSKNPRHLSGGIKVLIAILSCHTLRDWQKAVRGTWIRELPKEIDYRFFLGAPITPCVCDEVCLDVDDTFQGVTKKVVSVLKWAMFQKYDYVFKADLDTLVRPDLLIRCGFEDYDYMGGQNRFFASGGAGYWLSRKAMEYAVGFPISTGPEEDVHVARALVSNGIPLHPDNRFKFCPGDVMDDQTITYHLSSIKAWNAKSTPEELRSVWADQKERNYRKYGVSLPPVRSLRPRRFQ